MLLVTSENFGTKTQCRPEETRCKVQGYYQEKVHEKLKCLLIVFLNNVKFTCSRELCF